VAKGRPAAAVGPLEKIDPEGPLAADAALWKGVVLFQVRQVSRAIHWFHRALALRPDDSEVLRWLAAALYELGDHPDTVAVLTRITQLEPDDPKGWRTLALLNKENREFERACPAYEQALWLDPEQPLVRFELAETMVEMGQYRKAEEQLAACRGGVPESDRRALLLACLEFADDRERFRAVLDASIAEFPDHPGLIAFRARVDLTEGRITQALEGFNRVLAANPFRAQAFYQRGLANRRLGRTAAAERDLARSAELNTLTAEMDRLNRETGKNLDDPEIRYQLGRVCVLLGKPELGASWYVAALACDPHHPGARLGLKTLGREDLIQHPSRRLPTSHLEFRGYHSNLMVTSHPVICRRLGRSRSRPMESPLACRDEFGYCSPHCDYQTDDVTIDVSGRVLHRPATDHGIMAAWRPGLASPASFDMLEREGGDLL
jgi:tetratricopeptide (TPR) repeat protein